MSTSYSELETYMRCADRHYYKYVQGLENPRHQSYALNRGTAYHSYQEFHEAETALIHKTLINTAKGTVGFDMLPEEEQGKILAPVMEARELYDFWCEMYPYEEDVLHREVELDTGAWSGTPDAIIKREDGLVIRDYKTSARVTDAEHMLSFQPYYYMWVARETGLNVVGFEYDIVRSKPPAKPRFTKDGRIAYLSNIDTTAERLVRFATKHHLTADANVRQRIGELQERGNEHLYTRTYIPWRDEMHEVIGKQLSYWATRMITDPRGMSLQPYGSFDSCGSCPYSAACRDILQGTDPDWNIYAPRNP